MDEGARENVFGGLILLTLTPWTAKTRYYYEEAGGKMLRRTS
jgi:hypothetical protein